MNNKFASLWDVLFILMGIIMQDNEFNSNHIEQKNELNSNNIGQENVNRSD